MLQAKPILFSRQMIQAIQARRKTMTRRVMKEPWKIKLLKRVQADFPFLAPGCWANPGIYEAQHNDHGAVSITTPGGLLGIKPGEFVFISPYQPDDILWVRETHYRYGHWVKNGITKTGRQKWKFAAISKEVRFYENPPVSVLKANDHGAGWYKRPAIFLPLWAARIFLQVTDVRVERLREISVEDAKAEGLKCLTKDDGITWKYGIPDADGLPGTGRHEGWCWSDWCVDPRMAFKKLWDSINAARGHGWEKNDWVWAYTFKQIERPEGWPGEGKKREHQSEGSHTDTAGARTGTDQDQD